MQVHVWIGKSRIAAKASLPGQDINKGTTIIRYLGTKISKAQTARRIGQRECLHCYLTTATNIDGNT